MDAEVSFLPMEDLKVDTKYPSPSKTRTLSDVEGSYTYFAEGDVLLAKITPCFQNGKLGIAQSLRNGVGFGSSEFFVLRPNSDLDPEYLYYFLSRDAFRQEGVLRMGGSVGQQRVPPAFLLSQRIAIPPLSEQHRIVGILDEAFAGIATAKANAEKNRQSARAAFDSYLQFVFTERAKEWAVKQLGEICQRVSVGHVGPTSQFYCDPSIGIPFLRSQNVRRGELDWDGVEHITKDFHCRLKKSQLHKGDLLFVRVGANRGDCCAIREDVGELNCANIVFARPTEGNARFLERYCQSPIGRRQLLGMTTGSAQGVINTSSVAELRVPLPSLAKQTEYVRIIDAIDEKTRLLKTAYERKLTALDDLKRSLLHRAFSGQL